MDATDKPTQGMDRLFAETLLQLFELLERDRVDLILAPLLEGNYLKQQHPEQFQQIRYHPPPLGGTLAYYHVLHSKHRHLADTLATTLRTMKADGSIERITQRVIHSANDALEEANIHKE